MLFFVFKVVHLNSGKFFVGFHGSPDPWFATPNGRDPYLGQNPDLTYLIQRDGRSAFHISQMFCGAEQPAREFYRRTLASVIQNPMCLNGQVGSLPGVPKSEEHKAAIAETLRTVMQGNANQVGNEPLPEGKCRKWINNGVEEYLATLDKGLKPTLPDGYKLGRLRKAI